MVKQAPFVLISLVLAYHYTSRAQVGKETNNPTIKKCDKQTISFTVMENILYISVKKRFKIINLTYDLNN